MKVSIITPTFNSEKFISETIKSIINQTYIDWELLITDDYSNDNTWKTITEFSKSDHRIKCYRLEKNSGPGAARNNSIDHANGKYLAFCDSDDLWVPYKLEMQINAMKNGNCTLCHSSYSLVDEVGNSLHIKTKCKKYINYKDLIKYNWIGTSTVIFNLEALGKQYMPNISNRQDWALWLKLIKLSGNALFINEPLVNYTIRKSSISSKKSRLIKFHWLIYKELEGFNRGKSLYYLILNLVFHSMKRKYIKNKM